MRIPTIFEIATAYENRKTGEIDQKPNTNIVVSTTRIGYGKKSTLSVFTAMAYDKAGNKVDSIRGYFLEPETIYNKSKVKNSDTSIIQGDYKIISKKKTKELFNFFDKYGQNGIKINVHSK